MDIRYAEDVVVGREPWRHLGYHDTTGQWDCDILFFLFSLSHFTVKKYSVIIKNVHGKQVLFENISKAEMQGEGMQGEGAHSCLYYGEHKLTPWVNLYANKPHSICRYAQWVLLKKGFVIALLTAQRNFLSYSRPQLEYKKKKKYYKTISMGWFSN